jgi:hypothetical protein
MLVWALDGRDLGWSLQSPLLCSVSLLPAFHCSFLPTSFKDESIKNSGKWTMLSVSLRSLWA